MKCNNQYVSVAVSLAIKLLAQTTLVANIIVIVKKSIYKIKENYSKFSCSFLKIM